IITTASEGEMKKIHERTPFILDKKDIQRFLDPKASPNEIKEILNQKNLNLLIERANKEEQLSFF
uniref:SOS response-associated peptidase family protein n=1 Tax=Proteiniclasticum sp. TaxID=2053595 RepID=UPI00289D2CF0